MACEALERRREGREASVPDSISEISEISEDDMSVRSHGFPEDKEEMLVSQPAPASHRNGQGAPELAVPTAQVSETVTERQNGEIVIPPYDATKYVLGKLCPQGHEWGTTGQSLLRLPSRNCPTCVNASKREKRAGRRQATLS